MTAKEQGDSIIERYKELCPYNYIECALAAVSALIAEHTWQSPVRGILHERNIGLLSRNILQH